MEYKNHGKQHTAPPVYLHSPKGTVTNIRKGDYFELNVHSMAPFQAVFHETGHK